MHGSREALRLQHVPADRRRGDTKVGHIDPRGIEAGDHRPLDHSAPGSRVAARDDPGAALERRPDRGREARGGLRGQVDVDEPGDSVLAE